MIIGLDEFVRIGDAGPERKRRQAAGHEIERRYARQLDAFGNCADRRRCRSGHHTVWDAGGRDPIRVRGLAAAERRRSHNPSGNTRMSLGRPWGRPARCAKPTDGRSRATCSAPSMTGLCRWSLPKPPELIRIAMRLTLLCRAPRRRIDLRRLSSTSMCFLAQPVARPGVLTDILRGEAVPLSKLRAATSSDAAQEGVPVSAKTAEVQRLLTRVGYQIGDIDGVFGNRTEIAIRSFQKRVGGIVDGRISDGLVARLRRAAIRKEGAERSMARRSGYTPPRPPEDGGWLGSVVAGYQRFVGHNFNSVAHPGELQSYCRLQSDTWVFDEGSRRFLHCGQVTASK